MNIPRIFYPLVLVVALMLALWSSGAMGQTFVAAPEVLSLNNTFAGVSAVASSTGHAIVAWNGLPPLHLGVEVTHSSGWGGTWSPAFSVTGSTPAHFGIRPALAADSSGHAIVAWSGSGIHTAQSFDDGQSWSLPSTVAISPGGSQPEIPVIETDGAGTWILVWASNDSLGGTIGSDRDILMARSDDDGQTWTIGYLNSDAPSDSHGDADVRIASDGLGTWIAIWERSLSPAAWHLLIAQSTDHGLSWSAPQVVTSVGAAFSNYDVAVGAGRWHIVASLLFDVYLTRSDDGGSSWAPAQCLTPSPNDVKSDPTIATDGSGSWMLIWQSALAGIFAYDLVASRSGDNGTTWSAPAPPSPIPSFVAGNNENPLLITDSEGNWMVVWSRSLSGPPHTILSVRGVGPCPTASLTLTPSNPTPTSYLIDVTATGFTPGNDYFTCFTYELGEHHAGPWFGIDPLYDELAIQVGMLAPPFNGTFDAAGTSAFSWTYWGTPGPLGVTLYAVTIEHVTGNILRASPPITATL